MARIDRVRENYEDVTERLFSDKAAFEDYLKFAGKFFKLPSAQSMTVYGTNPKATMVADFDTWKKFNRHVKRLARIRRTRLSARSMNKAVCALIPFRVV